MDKTEGTGLVGAGVATIGIAYLSASVVPISPIIYSTSILIGTAITAIGFYIKREDELIKFFRVASLHNKDDELPIILSKKENEHGYVYAIKMPVGLCLSDFLKKQEHLEQLLNAKVSIKFNNCLIIDVNNQTLKTYYPFKLTHYNEPLKVAIGYSRKGLYELDIEEAIHILIAGCTGGGKSVLLRVIATALILDKTKEQVQLYLADFQRVDFGIFKNSDRVEGFCDNPKDFGILLKKLAKISTERLELFEQNNLINIKEYNKKNPNNTLPYIVVMVDEFGVLSDKKDVLNELKLRCQQDRKVGISYILSTQRPSADVIDSSIKTNIPTRISLKMVTHFDSQTVLGESGAENLRGNGHALAKVIDTEEIQVMYISPEQVRKLIKHTITKKPKKKEYNTQGAEKIC